MFENMLDHPNITIVLGTDYRDLIRTVKYKEMVYSGPIDEFFGYRFGQLPYRSLEFRHETLNQNVFQSAPVINYPNDHDYTRITEFKYLTGQNHSKTSVVYEFPKAEGDPYYPVPRPENLAIYSVYRSLAATCASTHFVGRLATYKYFNMDQVVGQALTLCSSLCETDRRDVAGLPQTRSLQTVLPLALEIS
jgi:UDP-galactopyranose mutase